MKIESYGKIYDVTPERLEQSKVRYAAASDVACDTKMRIDEITRLIIATMAGCELAISNLCKGYYSQLDIGNSSPNRMGDEDVAFRDDLRRRLRDLAQMLQVFDEIRQWIRRAEITACTRHGFVEKLQRKYEYTTKKGGAK